MDEIKPIITIGHREVLSFTGTGFNDGTFRIVVNTRARRGDQEMSKVLLGGRIQEEVRVKDGITAFGADISLRPKQEQ